MKNLFKETKFLKNEKPPQNLQFISNHHANNYINSESKPKIGNVNKINKLPVSRPINKKTTNINTNYINHDIKPNSAENKIKTNQTVLSDFKSKNFKN